MKKIYSIVLMATALLIGTTAWAANYTIGASADDPSQGVYKNLATFKKAMASLNLSSADVITLGAHQALAANGVYDFGGAQINTGSYRFNITAASTFTIKNAVISGTSNIFLGNKNNASGDVTLILENVKATTTGAQVFDVRVFNYNVTFDENCVMSSASQTFNVYDANVSMNVTNNADIDWSIASRVKNTKSHSFTNNAGNFTLIDKSSKTFAGDITINGSNGASAVINQLDDSRYPVAASLTLNDITVAGGTIVTPIQGSNITVTGGTFVTAPDASATGIIDGECKFPDGPQFGNLTVAPGYKVFNSGAIRAIPSPGQVVEVRHANNATETFEFLEDAFAAAQNGDVITLLDDVNTYTYIWIGTENVADAAKSLTLDLAGHTLTSLEDVLYTIVLTHGALYIKNSVPGQGGIVHLHSNTGKNASDIIRIIGSPERMKKGGEYINPRNAAVEDLFVYLLIDEGVTLSATNTGVNGVTVMENREYGNTFRALNYFTNIYSAVNPQYGVANGVRVDIKGTIDVTKYAGKVNGTIRHPNEMVELYPGQTDALLADTANGTFFHVFPTAVMHTSDAVEATAVYSSGYGRWLIEGLCQGATGVYVKSGVVDLTNAVIESTYTGAATISTGKGSGIDAGGNAVVIESNNYYTGQQAIVIGGDTKISTEAAGGAALVDVVDATHESKVDNITINGGSFSGDNAIVISSETASENSTTVNGVTVTGEITVGGSSDPADVAEIMGADTHTTVIENPDGTTTVVVSAGAAPTAATEWVDVAALPAGSDAKWTGFVPGVIGNGTDAVTVSLGELQIISGNAIDGVQELTIKDRATLNVSRLILNDFARIIVEAGGKLIVEGEQGINAPVVENITLKNEEGKHSIFLFNPAVTSNRHPNALFEILSYSWRVSATEAQSEVFGVPTHNAIKSVACLDAGKWGYLQVYNQKGNWENIAFTDDDPFPYDKLNKPFAAYALTAYRGQNDPKLTFQFGGELVGNVDATLTANLKWSFFANSYTAEVDLAQFLTGLETTAQNVDKTIYVAGLNGGGYWTWEALGIEEVVEDHVLTKLQPMQGFLLNNKGGHVESNGINYKSMVYDPYFPSASPAPRRMAANNNTAKMFVVVTNEVGAYDNVKLRETENTKSAEKFMNQDVNIYATAEEKSAILAAENLADTYVGFSTVKGGNFTISFTNVMGREFDLVDLETGARVAVAEGFEYNFTADANYANDYRFKIVERHFAPTGIENTEAVKNAKGIFTITGQYVGEMNVWNTLPAGVYVVNGEKRVK